MTLAVAPAARVDQLSRLLQVHRPRVLHIACHGTRRKVDPDPARPDEVVLALEDARGGRDELDAKELYGFISGSSLHTKLVILEACRSRSIAEELFALHGRRGLVVIGTRDYIEPEASTLFFSSLHEALAAGHSIGEAFARAQRDMELLAPTMRGLPMVCGDPSDLAVPLADRPPSTSFTIDPSHEENFVRMAAPLDVDYEVHGREQELELLDDHWFEEESPSRPDSNVVDSNIVHLYGPPGQGKTAILARWLELHRSRRWCGATRVFTWSFDPLAHGAGTGDVAAFLRQALDFFGGLEPQLGPGAAGAAQDGQWLQGLRLARLIRHERVLLCLDHLPVLPHSTNTTEHEPHEVLTPGLAAFLHELARGHAGLCVLTSRLQRPLRLPAAECHNLPIAGLQGASEVALLVERGVIESREVIEQLARDVDGNPLSLSMVAATLATGDRPCVLGGAPGHRPANPLALVGVTADERASRLLHALALRGGSLDAHELRLVGEAPSSSRDAWWDGFSPDFLAVLRMLRRRGVIRINPDRSVELAHGALLASIPSAAPPPRDLVQYSLDAIGASAEPARHLAACTRTIRVALGCGMAQEAVRVYREEICQRGRKPYQQNELARDKGGIADNLQLLAEFFERTPHGDIGAELRPEVQALPDVEFGFFHHQLGLALRHLGRMDAAAPRLQRAYEVYGDDHERAAICANDLAEVMLWQDRVDEALAWANRAVERAEQAVAQQGHEPQAAEPAPSLGQLSPLEMSQTALFVSLATRGHVRRRASGWGAATADFERATEVVKTRARGSRESSRHLFSRPGYYYWDYQFEKLCSSTLEPDALGKEVEQLTTLLEQARQWHEHGHVARVTRALDALARGQLFMLCHERGIDHPAVRNDQEGRDRLLDEALDALGFAIRVFRANQHTWMLASALSARARVHQALGDEVSRSRDEHEAEVLRRIHRHAGHIGRSGPVAER
ncbi:MAG: CHAT domain-containing protein [Myxococcales bacterium]|nr:CHAT domain-containing protein [Myxococcales bacterium]